MKLGVRGVSDPPGVSDSTITDVLEWMTPSCIGDSPWEKKKKEKKEKRKKKIMRGHPVGIVAISYQCM